MSEEQGGGAGRPPGRGAALSPTPGPAVPRPPSATAPLQNTGPIWSQGPSPSPDPSRPSPTAQVGTPRWTPPTEATAYTAPPPRYTAAIQQPPPQHPDVSQRPDSTLCRHTTESAAISRFPEGSVHPPPRPLRTHPHAQRSEGPPPPPGLDLPPWPSSHKHTPPIRLRCTCDPRAQPPATTTATHAAAQALPALGAAGREGLRSLGLPRRELRGPRACGQGARRA